ncbi:hypothetical protein DS909_01840 [Phaeobacter gallaeciensis]|uniref:Uncharacterized protein n=1 Tax=Phaeobacter gallaeciensis TaxID=60890 RepID=A0A366X8B1_9RHOB|nr:hypothetical protein DS909_01840 [Phaeobacter gallaeciensis]
MAGCQTFGKVSDLWADWSTFLCCVECQQGLGTILAGPLRNMKAVSWQCTYLTKGGTKAKLVFIAQKVRFKKGLSLY